MQESVQKANTAHNLLQPFATRMLYEICTCQAPGYCTLQEIIRSSLKALLFPSSSWSEFFPTRPGRQSFDPKNILAILITVPRTHTVKLG